MFLEFLDPWTEPSAKIAMWADNVKFVKDIIDSKYQKIDAAAAEVDKSNKHQHY